MQRENNFYVGIDVSKLWFDVSLLCVVAHQKQAMQTQRFDNTAAGLSLMGKWFKECKMPMNNQSLVVIENTGVYHRLIWQWCSDHNLPLHIGNAAQIKWSLGIIRGKDDVTDSKRLCMYGYQHTEELKASPILDSTLLELKDLLTARSRLLTQLTSTKVYLKELKTSNSKQVQKLLEQAHKAALEGLEKSILQVEAQIHQKLKENEKLKSNYDLLLSVPGIGHITAVYLLCCTGNFAAAAKGKQLASYAGVAPFGNTSGTSIKGRNKVHKMANKELKKLLHLCALSAVKNYPEFKQYYERKKEEGKHGMSIINAVRNKLALRVAAVIKEQRKYVNKAA